MWLCELCVAAGKLLACLVLTSFQTINKDTHGKQCIRRDLSLGDHLVAEFFQCAYLDLVILKITEVVLQCLENPNQPLDVAARVQALEELHEIAQLLAGLAQFMQRFGG